jgi:hypothetical protein
MTNGWIRMVVLVTHLQALVPLPPSQACDLNDLGSEASNRLLAVIEGIVHAVVWGRKNTLQTRVFEEYIPRGKYG